MKGTQLEETANVTGDRRLCMDQDSNSEGGEGWSDNEYLLMVKIPNNCRAFTVESQ